MVETIKGTAHDRGVMKHMREVVGNDTRGKAIQNQLRMPAGTMLKEATPTPFEDQIFNNHSFSSDDLE